MTSLIAFLELENIRHDKGFGTIEHNKSVGQHTDAATNVSTVFLPTSLVTSQTHRTTHIPSAPLTAKFGGLQIGDIQRRGSKTCSTMTRPTIWN